MKTKYDCIVIGGGPAGSTAAAIVAQAGFATMLVERERFPRFHVGESLMPETYWTLRRLGMLDKVKVSRFTKKIGVQFVGPSGKESQPYYFDEHDSRECAQTWHVERADFDKMLFDNATDRGADCFDQTKVVDVTLGESPPHEVVVKSRSSDPQTVSARVIVDATGQHSLLANRLRIKINNPKLRKAAIWGHFTGAVRQHDGEPEVTTILRTTCKQAWFWYIPLAGDKVSVGLVSDNGNLLKGRIPEQVFSEVASKCIGLQERLANAKMSGKLHVAKEFSYTSRQRSGNGWVLVGDAYGFIDPIYSTGVFLALKSGELAADCVVEGLRGGDTSAAQLGKWTSDFEAGVSRFRKLVDAFYTDTFSFADFVAEHPHHQRNLTDLLIGRAFTPAAASLIADLDRAVTDARSTAADEPLTQL